MRRTLRRLGYTWRRARRIPPKQPDAAHKARVERALRRLERLQAAGQCQMLFADESGFCLQPSVPYLWQKQGQRVGLPSAAHSRRLNVLGMLSHDGAKLHHFTTDQPLTSHFVIQSIESLLPTLTQPTVLVLDNAGPHRSQAVQERRSTWKRRGLRLLFLPPYCPQLNRIELLWRSLKQRWMPTGAYQSFDTLSKTVTDLLQGYGTKHRITFAR